MYNKVIWPKPKKKTLKLKMGKILLWKKSVSKYLDTWLPSVASDFHIKDQVNSTVVTHSLAAFVARKLYVRESYRSRSGQTFKVASLNILQELSHMQNIEPSSETVGFLYETFFDLGNFRLRLYISFLIHVLKYVFIYFN